MIKIIHIKSLLLCFALYSVGCQDQDSKTPLPINEEIAALKTLVQKNDYLEKIYQADQDIRDGKSSELILKYGLDSPEVLSFNSEMDSIDRLNLKKVEFYLKEFGYPSTDSVTREAAMAPWIVIHHSTDVDKRKRFFTDLFQAYNDGFINTDQFELYLGRTYKLEFGTYPFGEGAYDPIEKINGLIEALNLKK
jgi:hypothetical protein